MPEDDHWAFKSSENQEILCGNGLKRTILVLETRRLGFLPQGQHLIFTYVTILLEQSLCQCVQVVEAARPHDRQAEAAASSPWLGECHWRWSNLHMPLLWDICIEYLKAWIACKYLSVYIETQRESQCQVRSTPKKDRQCTMPIASGSHAKLHLHCGKISAIIPEVSSSSS